MQILIVTASLPYPPASGGAIRAYGIIHELHRAEHEITLLSFHDGHSDAVDTPLKASCTRIETVMPPLRSKVDRLRDLVFSRQPDIARRFYSEVFANHLRELLDQTSFDLIQFEGIETVCYLSLARQLQPSAKLVFDTFNAEYALQRSIFEIDRHYPKRWPAALYSYIQTKRITRFERAICQMADAVIAVSDEDAALLHEFRSDGRIFVMQSGIFVDDYVSAVNKSELRENALVFTGKMDYRPNVDAMLWFADEVLPLVAQKGISAPLYIVGQQPHARLNSLRQHADIYLTGWVELTQPYLQSAAVYVAPLRMGSGTRLKLLEAMASGCAIVATTTACAGLRSEAKQAMIIADTAQAMADGIAELLQDSARCRRLGEAARQAVRQSYDWPALIPKLLDAYREIGLE